MQFVTEVKAKIQKVNNKLFEDRENLKGKRISVSRILSSVKTPFDADGMAEKCAAKNHIEGYKYFGMSKEQILEQWSSSRNKGAQTGSSLDDWAQYRLSSKPRPHVEENSELAHKCKQFDKFISDVIKKANIQTVGTEVWISSNEITAKTDYIGLFKDKLIVFDWKQNKSISTTNAYGKNLVGPMADFEETESVIYTLQVHLYRYLLTNTYGMSIGSSRFVHFTELGYQIFDEAFEYDENFIKTVINHAQTLYL